MATAITNKSKTEKKGTSTFKELAEIWFFPRI
jgi:hypothetical protein